MSLLHYKKVYVMAPYKYATGGVELAHQLVDYLREKGKEAYIFYISDIVSCKIVKDDNQVTEAYRKYNIAVANSIDDSPENVVVIPESFVMTIPYFKKARLCIWWMSVENALGWNGNFGDLWRHTQSVGQKMSMLKEVLKWMAKRTPLGPIVFKIKHKEFIKPKYPYPNNYSIEKVRQEDTRLYHFYQATYIQQYLYSQHFDRIFRLTDYINPEILKNVDSSVKKENIILYNPAKGLKYTQKLMKCMPGYKFIPLKGYTREQLNHLFDQAKLYIDFGPFPGKDRLPREAAIHNCCIITGRFGASGYFEDIPINGKYKFDMLHANYYDIKARIDDVLDNYDDCINDFKYMRESIKHEQENFYREIDNIFI